MVNDRQWRMTDNGELQTMENYKHLEMMDR